MRCSDWDDRLQWAKMNCLVKMSSRGNRKKRSQQPELFKRLKSLGIEEEEGYGARTAAG
jgi:hypothetical protein